MAKILMEQSRKEPGAGEYSSLGFRAFVKLDIDAATAADAADLAREVAGHGDLAQPSQVRILPPHTLCLQLGVSAPSSFFKSNYSNELRQTAQDKSFLNWVLKTYIIRDKSAGQRI